MGLLAVSLVAGSVLVVTVIAALIGWIVWVCVRRVRAQDVPLVMAEVRGVIGALRQLLPGWYGRSGRAGQVEMQAGLEPAAVEGREL